MNENPDIIGNSKPTDVLEHAAKGGVVDFNYKKGPLVGEQPSEQVRSMQARVQQMVGFPSPIKLTPAEETALRKCAQGKQALQTWVQMIQEQAEARIRAIVELEQKTMLDIQQQHKLDFDKVLWQFDPTSGQLVPTQMRLR